MFQIKSFEFSPIQENTYLLYNELNECIIVDPGCYFDDEKQTLHQFVNDNHLTPKLLVNTHCHLDHVFGNKFVAETFKLKLHIHLLEQKLLEYAPVSGLTYNMPFDNYTGDLNFIEAGQVITLGTDELEVLFTPGHSPGSVSFYCQKQAFVISGDVLFQNSIGRTDLPGGDHETLLTSIRTQLFVLPDETVVYSGHGNKTSVGEEKKNNPFFK